MFGVAGREMQLLTRTARQQWRPRQEALGRRGRNSIVRRRCRADVLYSDIVDGLNETLMGSAGDELGATLGDVVKELQRCKHVRGLAVQLIQQLVLPVVGAEQWPLQGCATCT